MYEGIALHEEYMWYLSQFSEVVLTIVSFSFFSAINSKWKIYALK
jgi:hypothetical protein